MGYKLYENLKQEERELKRLQRILQKAGRNQEGISLRVMNSRGRYPQYYIYDKAKKDEYPNGKYVSKKEFSKVKKLAQNEYNVKMKNEVETRLKVVSRALGQYKKGSFLEIYNKTPIGRRMLINCIVPTEEENVEEWKRRNTGGKNPYEEPPREPTDSGIFVRSKSERIIANKLYELGIPFVYEPELVLENGKCIYPDFLMLNVRDNRSFYYEHFGIMNDMEYCMHNLEKIKMYENNGYWFGENLLYSFEYGTNTLDMENIENMLKKYIL